MPVYYKAQPSLGPLFFLIYICSLSNITSAMKFFASDTSTILYCSKSNYSIQKIEWIFTTYF